ncbi:protein YIF1A, putative [Entamoeba invadens IP1]|uniref:Protein YIF1 n=2 Tax=Entamoeba invadens TaxID=33085 RepID=A0A0A1U761_ENTIV|nr:protein YIF1A, putative [Entamoeba invadens IP1]ELP87816.1 protein YIF1A, putative [Entamoeba invadens IP1]BAN40217.1 protein YIF1A, putative [Entamoeba invadens]BAN41023.1 protein YIF1A, putative [Entamoeba invadens]|eukprot:XP_004254587.1 protein YIF1A, putative [Entamoeba invadens IP1]
MTSPQPPPSSADAFFDNVTSNPLASAGISVANTYLNQGDELLKSQLGGIFSFDSWRYYFNVSTTSVFKRLLMTVVPYAFRGDWTRTATTAEDQSKLYSPPKEDKYAPDLYVPLMSFITYVLFVGFYYGSKGTFTPETLSVATTLCLMVVTLEVMIVKFLEYMLFDVGADFRVYLSYLSYVFVPVIICSLVGTAPVPYIQYVALVVFGSSFAFFIYKTLMGGLTAIEGEMSKKRMYAILIGLLQIALIFFMMK